MPETKKAIDGIENLRRLVASALCPDEKTYQRFLRRMEEGALTRDENPASHFCVYFLPFNPQTREVFIVHHKKSGLWLSPGGHLDRDETPEQAVVREIREELGMEDFFSQSPVPFFFSIVDIENERQSCKTHHDIWYPMFTDGSGFSVDPTEFFATKWIAVSEAGSLVTDPSNLLALGRIQDFFEKSGGSCSD